MKLVLIEWVDSAQPISKWQYMSEFEVIKPVECVSVGYLIHDGKDVKAIAPNIGDKNNEEIEQISGVIHIPTRSITKIKELKQ